MFKVLFLAPQIPWILNPRMKRREKHTSEPERRIPRTLVLGSLLVLAFTIRLILMPISTHSDLFFINAFPNLLASQGVFDVYSFIRDNIPSAPFSYYPPLTYFTFGLFQFIYQFFSTSFSPWMANLLDLYTTNFQGQAADFIRAAPNAHITRDLFLAKLPYLIFDLAAVWVLLRFIKKRFLSKTAIIIWLFNPASLYAVYMVGQFELIPAFFVLLGFLLLTKNTNLGVLMLGIAAAYKNYAFLFILPTVLIYGHTWRQRTRLLAISLAPYLIFLIPTFATNAKEAIFSLVPKVYLGYRKPLEGWPLYSQIIKYILLTFSLMATLALSSTLKLKDKWHASVGISLAMVLLVFALAPRISFHYLLWTTPLVVLWFKRSKVTTAIIAVQAMTLASYKLLANHLQAGLFAPISPDYAASIVPINQLIDKIIPYWLISGFGFFVFFFLNLYLAAKIFYNLIFQTSPQAQKGRSDKIPQTQNV